MSLEGRVALVTGGSRGIGRAIALLLAERGADVAVNYTANESAAREVCDAIAGLGRRAIAVRCDVSDADSVEAAVKRVVEQLGSLALLVNNAGISIDSLCARAREEDWQRTIDVNLKGAFLCTKAASRQLLKARRHGRVINVSSVIGEMGNAGQAMYASSKAGLLGLTRSLAREFAPRGVTVNAITPGFIETDMTDAGLHGDARDRLLQQIPLARIGGPDDVAEAAAFLAADAGGYITGHALRVNGGLLI
ncbi:MAG: 3-oxoacyl-[acyl-carrier-protein] reductase [Myxococcales bacterium FL481]|nr:MAG: 3-oxoacyl-[acyl-carrier-protein] reductase [Myxococcales bacterium FL481]